MPAELLELDQVRAIVMPGHGQPGEPGGDKPAPDDEEEEEPEGDPT